MTKIKNVIVYEFDDNISDGDYVIGSDADTSAKLTKNYKMSAVRDYILSGLSPELGGTLKIAEVIYNGGLYSEPFQVANALNPAIEILQYNIVIFTINGDRYILKSQNVTIGAGQDVLEATDFITLSSYKVLGDGTPVWKGYNSATKQHEIYSLKSSGIQITLEQVSGVETGNIKIEKKAGINLGEGIPFYKGRNATTFLDEHYTAGTNSLTIQKELDEEGEETGIILFDIIEPTDIPRFIVNSASQSEEETGTLSKPFKTIQGALNAFVGTGTPTAPQFAGAEIIIQKGNGYLFTGSINYNSLTVILEEGTSVTSNPSIGIYLCDFDSLPSASANIRFLLKEGSLLSLSKSGFRNSGTSVASNNFQISKLIRISGTGVISQTENGINDLYSIFESNFTSGNTFNNDGFEQFQITGITLQTVSQSIYKKGGNSRLIINDINAILAGNLTLPTSTKFFNQIGGTVRWIGGSIGCVVNFNVSVDALFPLTKTGGILCELFISNVTLSGRMTTVFQNIGTLQSTVEAKSNLTEFFINTNTAKSPSVMWTGCALYNNIFTSGKPDFTQVDLTKNNSVSSYNIFAGNVNESLRSFSNRASAVSGGLTKGDKFINTGGVTSPTTGWFIDMIM